MPTTRRGPSATSARSRPARFPADRRAVPFGTIKTVASILLDVDGSVSNVSVAASPTTAAAAIGTVSIAGTASLTVNAPRTVTTFTVAEELRNSEIGAGYKAGTTIATMTVG